jgi:tetratricopeptide (TPR) repeat protein
MTGDGDGNLVPAVGGVRGRAGGGVIHAPPGFSPPTPDQLAEHLDQYPPRAVSGWGVWGPVGGVAILAMLGLAAGGPLALLLPWAAVLGLLLYLSYRVRRSRDLEAQTSAAQELAMLRQFPEALRTAWRLLPQLSQYPLLHARVVALMAHCLDQVKQYEAALVGYDYLIEHLPADNPGVVQLRVQRTLAALQSDRLTEADDALRRLRGVIDRYAGSAIAGGYRLAQLLQQVRTHHFADVVADADADDPLEALRPLGVEAGYGHAMIALAYRQAPQLAPERAREAADLWWSRATLLLPEATLVDRFPDLRPLTSAVAAPRPIVAPEPPAPPASTEPPA